MSRPTKTTVYLDGDDYYRLMTIARRRGMKTAAIVREAVAQYARREDRRDYPRSIGMGASGIPDLARNMDKYMEGFGADALSPKSKKR